MYEKKSVSIAMATYKEKKSIRKVINDFFATGFVDEVVVVNNNAEKGTNIEVKKTKAKLVHEPNQGYGYAFIRAITEASGDLVVICEPDGTFVAQDLERLLVYSKDFNVVLGTRTSQIGSLSGAGMGVMRKFANVLEAKTIEVLFNSVALTDVGCAYKLFSKKALKKITPLWKMEKSPLFNTELILLTVSLGLKFVEIPVTYNKRIGKSSIVAKRREVVWWAIVIQAYIIIFWVKWFVNKIIKKY